MRLRRLEPCLPCDLICEFEVHKFSGENILIFFLFASGQQSRCTIFVSEFDPNLFLVLCSQFVVITVFYFCAMFPGCR